MIRVYTSPQCQQCNAVKRWLTQRNVPFATVDISLDENAVALAALKALGYTQAPVVFVGAGATPDVHWYGFNTNLLALHTEGLQEAAT